MQRYRFVDWLSHVKERNLTLFKEYESIIALVEGIEDDAEHLAGFADRASVIVAKVKEIRRINIRTVVSTDVDSEVAIMLHELLRSKSGRIQFVRAMRSAMSQCNEQMLP